MITVSDVSQVEEIFRKISNLESEQFLDIEANRILGNIKDRHGKYPNDINWAPLKQETINRKRRGDTPLLETGELQESYNVKSLPGFRSVGSDIDKAVFMEKGTVNIPSRPVVLPEARKQDTEFVNNFNTFLDNHISKYI